MGKETKIGLGVIAVLLAIFVFVVFRKFWGTGEEEVAAAETAKPTAAGPANPRPAAPASKPQTPAKKSAPPVANSSRAAAWPSNQPTLSEPAKPNARGPAAGYDNPFRAVSTPSSSSSAEGPGLQQPGNQGGQSQTGFPMPDSKPKEATPTVASPALAAPSTAAPASQPSAPTQIFSPFHQPAEPAASSTATAGDVNVPPALAGNSVPDAAATGLASSDTYDPLGSTPAVNSEGPASSRRAPALLDQSVMAHDAAVEPAAAEGYPPPPAQSGNARFSAPRTTSSGPPPRGMYGGSAPTQHAASTAPLSRSSAGDLSQADAYNVAGGGAGHRPSIQHSAPSYDPQALQQQPDRLPGERLQPSFIEQEPVQQLGPDRRYVVQPNDNYWSISQKVFGTGAYFKAILQHQRDRGRAIDERLQPGEVMAIPPAELLARDYPHLCPRQPPRSAAASQMIHVSTPRHRDGGRGMYYVVEEGDTLFDIARYELGKATRWVEIYELNREQIGEDFHHLKPGTQLILPGQGVPESVTRAPSRVLQR